MSYLRFVKAAPFVVVSLVACGGGGDEANAEFDDSPSVGPDPTLDSDEDGVTDVEEEALGSDPQNPDSDEDTYLDGWEVAEGKDPNDPESRIYKGYWPYNPDKADLEDVGWSGEPLSPGDKVGNHDGRDQFNQKVELFDFFDHGKDILVDASAQWCGPCQVTALWISTHGAVDYYGYEPIYGDLRKAIDAGDIFWVTVLVENNNGGDTTATHVAQWDADFPHEKIPVVTDPGDHFMQGVIYKTNFFPSGVLLNPQGKVVKIGGMDDVMREAQNRLADR